MAQEGLFGAAVAAPSSPKVDTRVAPATRRTKLYPYDSTASQSFEPIVDSQCGRQSQGCLPHSPGCSADSAQSTDAWHVGAGISQTAQALLLAIEHIERDDVKRFCNKEFYEPLLTECKGLKPHLETLNFGKGGQGEQKDAGSFRALKKQKTSAAGAATPAQATTVEEVKAAAKALHGCILSQTHGSAASSLCFVRTEGFGS
eukprot:6491345-Amphidinium_carterae.1